MAVEYAGLFVSAFLAATLVPVPSEVPLALLVRRDDQIFWPVLIATTGNYLGACTTYGVALGLFGRRAVRENAGRGALSLFRRYGAPALLLSWVPIIGDGIVAVAGAARLPFQVFSAWTIIGKAVRYIVVAWLALDR